MSDRELLEAAARAYWGDEVDDVMSFRWDEGEQSIAFIHGDNQDHNGADVELMWRPLTDDGDALRLAVKLGLTVQIDLHDDKCTRILNEFDGVLLRHMHWHEGADSATRRAIVRAAASLAPAAGEVGS